MNNYFILSLVSFVSAVVIIALKVCYASKCEKISVCWGAVEVDREPRLENKELRNGSSTPDGIQFIKQMKNLRNEMEVVGDREASV